MSHRTTISSERWAQVQEIFHSALERGQNDRTAFLDDACADDDKLRNDVITLLEAHDDDGLLDAADDSWVVTPSADQGQRLREALADRYAIERPLGVGGMATVYLADDLRHNRKVAIKVLRSELSASLGVDRFLREIRIVAGLRHPHILPLYDSGEADDLLYYVMPAEGESLRHRIARLNTIPLQEALKITREVLDALHYAHGEGVVHRDIKPENILLSHQHAIVADFGIARAIRAAGGEMLTQAGLPIGTPAYMSPEQLGGDPLIDGRSDVYGVGCVLYELLTGSPPVPGHARNFFDLRTAEDTVPSSVERALRKSLAPDCDDRFATAADFADALASMSDTGPPFDAAQRSIAVLPFANMSADPENEYFSDGISEEIINALTQIEGLHVAARTSSFATKGDTRDIGEIGAKLNVETVLEGSVRQAGSRIRIMAQLINVADGFHIWSQRYDRELTDVFLIQDEIARTIADRLKLTLTPASAGRLIKPPTDDIEAYQLYLKGRHLWNRRTKPGLKQSIEYLKRAIERDAEFALAHAGLADTYLLRGSYGYMPMEDAHSEARIAVERALELDDTVAEAHAARGQCLRLDLEWEAEEAEYRRAIELNPSYPTAHQWYATMLASQGRFDEALVEIRRAEQLDPLSHAISVTVAVVLFLARRYDEMSEQLQRTLELEPNFASVHAWLGILYAEKGWYDKVGPAVERAVELNPDNPNVLVGLAYALAKQGLRDEALEILHKAEEGNTVSWTPMVYTALGEHDRAFEWLEEAALGGESWNSLLFLKVWPWYDPLRSDPRFDALLRRMKFSD